MSGTGDESGTPHFGALSLMTLNINGFRTKIKKGSKMVKKYRELGRHLVAKDVDLAAIQEPHFSSHATKAQEHTELSEFFSNMGYGMLSNFLGEGRGGGGSTPMEPKKVATSESMVPGTQNTCLQHAQY